MEKIIEKISRYHLVNTFIPGVLFVYLSQRIVHIQILTKEIVFDFFLIYTIGIICNRVGSLLVEPMLKWIKVISFCEYKKYVEAEKLDMKLSELNTDNNFYRSVVGTCLLAAFLMGFNWMRNKFPFVAEYTEIIILVLCGLLFVCSYRKQTNYIKERVESNIQSHGQS